MYMLIVYDTEKHNCVKLHKLLKRYLNWNQNSVFEGIVTEAQYFIIRQLLEEKRSPESFITIYSLESDKILKREELGGCKGNVSNIL